MVHGFAGSLQQAERWCDRAMWPGVGGKFITYPRASKTRDMARFRTRAVAGDRCAGYAAKGVSGQPNRPEAARVFDARSANYVRSPQR